MPSSSRPQGSVFLGSRLARHLFALFVIAALTPLALSDWLANSAVTQIAEGLSLHNRAQTTRQTSRQVFDRLLACRTLLAAIAVTTSAPQSAGAATALPGLGPVFRRIAHVRADGGTDWSIGNADDLALVWSNASSGLSAAKGPSRRPADVMDIQLRVAAAAGGATRLLLAAHADGVLSWIAELNAEYVWAPVTETSEDSVWQVLAADGRTLFRHTGADLPPATADAGDGHPGEDLTESRSQLFLGGEFGAGDWEFVQRAPHPQVRWQGGRLNVWLGLVAIATLLSIALLSQWQIRRTLTPLLQLTDGTRQLAAGAKGTRVATGRDDELGALAGAFNDMAAHIEAQFDALEGLAAIDRDILAGAPIERLAERVLRQLAAIYPGGQAAVVWREGATGLWQTLPQDPAGGAPTPGTRRIELSPEQADAFGQLALDESRVITDRVADGGLTDAPWQHAACTKATRRLVVLPLRQHNQTRAAIAIGLPTPDNLPANVPDDAPDQWHAARELRDRLTVAFTARAREEELVYRAAHDSLTGLTNRYGLYGQLEALLGASRPAAQAAVLFLDLDHFKDVNDTRGHEAGDELLCLASARLLACVPAGAVVARQGGDEFAVVLPGADAAQACAVAIDAVARLGEPFVIPGGDCLIGASIGIALSPDHGQRREELLRCADIALYAAKAAGRGRFMLFSAALDEAALERVRLQSDLRIALEQSEFVAYYQPRVRPEDGAITSAEALIRWRHPARGLLSPNIFIAIAESSGLIDGIGAWMLDTACAQLAAWRRDGIDIGRIAVNVSQHQLNSGHLPGQVRAVLDRHALPAEALEIEVTESLLAGAASEARAQLAELRGWGVTIALDDFGTGYSSMAMLRQLPIDVMKIDQSFVSGLGDDHSAMAVTRAIVALAHSLRLDLVAEGIETATQATILGSMGCNELQGYLYGQPVPADDFIALAGLRRARSVEPA